jgi:hypothetical protein
MVKFCRNCGKELVLTRDKTCSQCGVKPTRATSYCRYCGGPTRVDDTTCPKCGAAVRPIPGIFRINSLNKSRLVRLGIIVNLILILGVIAAFVIFSLPKSVTAPIKSAVVNVIKDTTGYTAYPLSAIAVVPHSIPPFDEPVEALRGVNEVFTPEGVAVNTSYRLTVYAVFQNAAKSDVSGQAAFKSNNELVAIVDGSGLVTTVGTGSATITVSYTAAPGSSNISDPAPGKIPVIFTAEVPVNVQ